MCGIAGFFAPDPHSPHALEAQVDALHRRGPDGGGMYLGRPSGCTLRWFGPEGEPVPHPPTLPLPRPRIPLSVGLGIRRLALVDVAGGVSPISNTRGDVMVVLNGEIYNHRALRQRLRGWGHTFRTRSDTEVLAHLYEEGGMDALLAQVRGQFAIALFDLRRGQLFLARDPMGIKSLYVGQFGEGSKARLLFGSELKGVLADPTVPRQLDLAALGHYLSGRSVPAPLSIHRGIGKLLAGEVMTVGLDAAGTLTTRTRTYWQLPDGAKARPRGLPAPSDVEGWIRRVERTLDRAVTQRLPDEVPAAGLLSGGIDSGLVMSSVGKAPPPGFKAFSLTIDDDGVGEGERAQAIARSLGLDHALIPLTRKDLAGELPFWAQDFCEPLADHSLFPTAHLASAVRAAGYPAALSGDGGDELFAGYPTHLLAPWQPLLGRLPTSIYQSAQHALECLPTQRGHFGSREKLALLLEGAMASDAVARQARWMGAADGETLRGILSEELLARLPTDTERLQDRHLWAQQHLRRSPLGQMLAQDVRFYLQDQVLAKVDRAFMGNGVEVRTPMLDLEMVSLAQATPDRLKIHRGKTKWLLRKLAAERLPETVAWGPKKGFAMPTGRWLRELGAKQMMDWLTPPSGTLGIFDEAALESLVRAHASGESDHWSLLWGLLIFRLWQRGSWAATSL